MDIDLFSPACESRLLRAPLDIYSHPLISPAVAAALRAGLPEDEP